MFMKQVISLLTYLFSVWSVGAFTTTTVLTAAKSSRRYIQRQRHVLTLHDYKRNNKKIFELAASASSLNNNQDKTDGEILFLIETILKSSLVTNEDISDSNLLDFVEACESKLATRNDDIYMQGENEYIYLIKEGRCRVFLEGNEAPGEISAGHLFAYTDDDENSAKSVIVTSNTFVYYQIQEAVFRKILGKSIVKGVFSPELDYNKDQGSISNPIDEKNDLLLTTSPSEICTEQSFDTIDDAIVSSFRKNPLFLLWSDYDGSILQLILFDEIVLSTLVTTILVLFIRIMTGETLLSEIDDFPFLQSLRFVKEIWEKQMEFTTLFSLLFFYNSFSFWQSIRHLNYKLDTEISTFLFLIRTNFQRDAFGDLTVESEEFLEDICKTISREQKSICTSDAQLEMALIRMNEAIERGFLSIESSTEGMILQKIVDIRAASKLLSTKLDERIPIVYVQFVQIVVDLFLFVAPFALYIDLQEYSIIAVGMLTLLYSGLTTLAKICLYPFDKEEMPVNTILGSNLVIFLICCISLELNHLGVLSFWNY